MNTVIANVLKRETAKAWYGAGELTSIAIFCGIGLLASLCLMLSGIEIGAGF